MQWRRGPTVKAQRTPGGQEQEHRVQLVFRGGASLLWAGAWRRLRRRGGREWLKPQERHVRR